MKESFGLVSLGGSIALFFDIIKSLPTDAGFWSWFFAGVLFVLGLELIIDHRIENANKKLVKKLEEMKK